MQCHSECEILAINIAVKSQLIKIQPLYPGKVFPDNSLSYFVM